MELRSGKMLPREEKQHYYKKPLNLADLKIAHQAAYSAIKPEEKDLYHKLAEGQSPKIMLVTCSDSRIEPDKIFGTQPGDIFHIRNVANLIPDEKNNDSTHAALKFAIDHLGVNTVVVMGHVSCGGIAACVSHVKNKQQADANQPHSDNDNTSQDPIIRWVSHAEASVEKVLENHPDATHNEHLRMTEKQSVLASVEKLKNFSYVKKAIQERGLEVAGALFDIKTAQVKWSPASCLASTSSDQRRHA